ncbi:unnamed protein product [Discula destructiva]
MTGVQATTTSHPSVTEKYRRNGKLQSCEPCRKSKLRCDHVVPACGRCVKRGRTSACFYHPNPLTQQPRQPPPNSLPTPTSSASQQSSPQQSLHQSVELYVGSESTAPVSSAVGVNSDALNLPFNFNSPPTSDVNHAQCQSFHRAASAPPLDCAPKPDVRRNTGFQGPTSHFSILEETLGVLEPEPGDLDAMDQQQNIIITNSRITQGCQILAFFAKQRMIERFISKYHEICDDDHGVMLAFVMKTWLQQLYHCHSSTLTSTTKQDSRGMMLTNPDPARIRKLSERIWQNTLTPVEFDGTTSLREWSRLGSGDGLRWEVLGLIASSIGLVVMELPTSDPIFEETKVSRSCVLGRMQEIAEKCLIFCRHCEVLDDPFIWLLLQYSCFIQVVKGDRHYASYRASGEACSAVIAMGLHQANRPTEKVPFFLAELRKRAFLGAYYGEISLATCLGRPPRLSYRYCTIDPPLDLTQDQLVLTGDKLEAALAALDEDGYNRSGTFQSNTFVRAWANFVLRREDVVDLALGSYSCEEVITRAKIIQEKTQRHIASLPVWLQRLYTEPLEFIERQNLKTLQLVRVGALRTGSQAIEILLQRVLIRKTGASSERLILATRKVFRDVLQVTSRHDFATLLQASYNAYLYGHGLRSAAIIAVELLKQEMLPVYPENPLLPRSQTIQDLSIFAARLAAVDPSDLSSNLCEQGHRVISKILDRILSPGGARQDVDKSGSHEIAQPRPMSSMNRQMPRLLTDQMSCDVPMNSIGPPSNSMGMGLSDVPACGMMDIGIGIEAPVDLGQDIDFVRWLDGMDWGMDNWSL